MNNDRPRALIPVTAGDYEWRTGRQLPPGTQVHKLVFVNSGLPSHVTYRGKQHGRIMPGSAGAYSVQWDDGTLSVEAASQLYYYDEGGR